jgi:hypothetical protein
MAGVRAAVIAASYYSSTGGHYYYYYYLHGGAAGPHGTVEWLGRATLRPGSHSNRDHSALPPGECSHWQVGTWMSSG